MILSKYGVARHIYVPIIKRDVVDFAVSADWTPAAGDVKISKDGGAAANVTNLPTAITMGNTAMWDFSLTLTEMQAAQVMVTVADSAPKAVEDQMIIIETYGNASAQHPFDLASATTTPGANTITSSVIAANAIGSSQIATNAIGASQLAANAIGSSQLAAGAIANGKFGAGAIDAAAVAADAIGASELAADAVTEIVTGVWAATMTELAAVPGVTATVLQALEWLFLLSRNKRTQTAATETVFKDDQSTTLATSTKSDNGTTFSRGEYA